MDLPINRIICGDCLEVMKDWPDGCIDMGLTSPPYGDLRDYKGYVFDFETIAKQLFRVIKKGGVLVWVEGDQVVDGSESGDSFRHALYFKSIGFNLHDTMIYKKDGSPFPEQTRYLQNFEYMFVLSNGPPKTVHLLKEKTVGYKASESTTQRTKDGRVIPFKYERGKTLRSRYNVWLYGNGYMKSSKEPIAFEHPATFPEDLAKDHIISWSNPDDIILDPMVGSGTTCKMAKLLGRRYIGIDISPEYCKIAEERLEAVDTGVPVKEARKGQIPLFKLTE